MTWGQILADRDYNHSVEVGRLVPAARRRLSALRLDVLDEVFRLRLTGRERVWGYFPGGPALQILWWDPEHQVCPSHKAHT